MDHTHKAASIDYVLSQERIPIVVRLDDYKELLVRIPYQKGNRAWISKGMRNRIQWSASDRFWIVPRSKFNSLIERILEEYGHVYVIQPHKRMQKCSPACMNAKRHVCECSCMGLNHGSCSDENWHVVSDTFAFKWDREEAACRLIARKDLN